VARDPGEIVEEVIEEPMPTTHSGFMIQSNRPSGDFGLVVADPANDRLAHCHRNNEDPELSLSDSSQVASAKGIEGLLCQASIREAFHGTR
jgi:hypothetical protein